jgi:hypothetical protein
MKLFNPFKRTPVSERVSDDLHQARLDLHGAKANQEYYNAMVPMLEARVQRMETELADADAEGNVARLNRRKQGAIG